MISMFVPGAIAFIIIFAAVSYEIYNQISAMEKRMSSAMDELNLKVNILTTSTKQLTEVIDKLSQKEKALSGEIIKLQEDAKRERIKKTN